MVLVRTKSSQFRAFTRASAWSALEYAPSSCACASAPHAATFAAAEDAPPIARASASRTAPRASASFDRSCDASCPAFPDAARALEIADATAAAAARVSCGSVPFSRAAESAGLMGTRGWREPTSASTAAASAEARSSAAFSAEGLPSCSRWRRKRTVVHAGKLSQYISPADARRNVEKPHTKHFAGVSPKAAQEECGTGRGRNQTFPSPSISCVEPCCAGNPSPCAATKDFQESTSNPSSAARDSKRERTSAAAFSNLARAEEQNTGMMKTQAHVPSRRP